MKWKKLGRVFCPIGQFKWMQSHAAVPFVEHLSECVYRIYFTTRDALNRSHIGWVVIDITRPQEILDISQSPVIAPGNLGCFDDSGAMGSWLVISNNVKYLYYQGWNLGTTVPFRNSIGLAVCTRNENFHRLAEGPIIDRSMKEPHFCGTPCVIKNKSIWHMWYLSCIGWYLDKGRPMHRYHIKYAVSQDGIDWQREGSVAIDFASVDEYAISRPSVIKEYYKWKMWYSYRGSSYRIGYAESEDAINWIRRDNIAGIDISASGWDSEMVGYPFVFDNNGQRYMLYNGNGYGQTGFGLAVLENE